MTEILRLSSMTASKIGYVVLQIRSITGHLSPSDFYIFLLALVITFLCSAHMTQCSVTTLDLPYFYRLSSLTVYCSYTPCMSEPLTLLAR